VKYTDREFDELMESARVTEGYIVLCLGGAADVIIVIIIFYWGRFNGKRLFFGRISRNKKRHRGSCGEVLAVGKILVKNESFDGKCPICKRLELKSKVYVGTACTRTLMAGIDRSYYDEEGNFHYDYKDPNYTTCGAKCTLEHHFQVLYYQNSTKVRFGRKMLENAQGR